MIEFYTTKRTFFIF